MTKHTPGEWMIEGNHIIANDNWKDICMIIRKGKYIKDEYKVSLEEAQANARLIASAPELLEAFKEYIKVMGPAHENECPADDTCNCKWKYINDKVNQAIVKAEGNL